MDILEAREKIEKLFERKMSCNQNNKKNRENLKNEIEEILNEFNYSYANYKVNVLGYSDYVGVFPANDDTYELWRRLGFVDIDRR